MCYMSKKTITTICDGCSKTFEKPEHNYKYSISKGYKIFCSSKCSNNFRSLKPIECNNCQKAFKPKTKEQLFCSKSCGVKISNKFRIKTDEQNKKTSESLKKFYIENGSKRSKKLGIEYKSFIETKCPACNLLFLPKTRKQIACSKKCGFELKLGYKLISKEELDVFILETYSKLNRTPQKREIPKKYVSASINHYGSYNKALLSNNIKPNSFKHKKTKVVCRDGHETDSINESYIDDWLFDNNIEHILHSKYPIKDRAFLSDFYLPQHGLWLEFLGLSNNKNYDEHYEEKLLVLKENGIHPFLIYPKDLKELDKKLKSLLWIVG